MVAVRHFESIAIKLQTNAVQSMKIILLFLQMLSIPFNPYTWDSTKQRVNSDVLALDLKDDTRKLIKVSNLSNNVFIVTPLKPQTVSLESPQYFTQNDNLRFHVIDVEYENTLIMLEVTPTEAKTNLYVYLRYGQRPTTQTHDLNATVTSNGRCVWTPAAHDKKGSKTECSFNNLAPIETLAKRPGKYFLGVKSLNSSVTEANKRKKRSCFGGKRQKRSCVEVKDPPPTPPQGKNVTVVPVYNSKTDQNYTLRVALGSCVYWSEEREMWMTDGCQVSHVNFSFDPRSSKFYRRSSEFFGRHHFRKLKITNLSAVLVLSHVRPSNDLTFCNVSARQGFSNF